MLRLGDIVRRHALPERFRDKVALVQGTRRVTYGELNRHVNRIANALLALGVERGDRVAVLGRNSVEYCAIYFALAKAGAVMVPLNFRYRPGEITYATTQSGTSWFLYEAALGDQVAAARPELPSVRRFLVFGDGVPDGPDSLSRLATAAGEDEPGVEVAEDDPRIIMYTSGTTGFPKGATLSHRQQYLHALLYAHEVGMRASDVALLIYPLFHAGGTDCLLLPLLLVGGTAVILDRVDAQDILTAAVHEQATFLFCVPTVWRRITRALDEHPVNLAALRMCVSSSDTIPRELLHAIKKHVSAPVIQLYGLTEAGVITHFLRPEHHEAKLGSVGRPHPLVDVRIVDADGADVPPGQVGEIVMKGPTLMLGYWDMPEKTAETIRDGWLHSGDLGRVDDDGFLYLMGRMKDLIISGGENIYPAEIERVLREHPGVRDVAVVGIPDPEWSESVLAVVVPAEDVPLTEADVVDFVRDRLAGFKKPRFVRFVDTLPVTSATGKVQKAELRRRYADLATNPRTGGSR
jgi:fatty-acyl-CoA synthase